MKIAFFCGSLEPGRDGVGDYTRRLAAEIERAGHAAFLISLQDRWLTGSEPLIAQNELRFPASIPWEERLSLAAETLRQWQPDLLSLQFVPFAYDPRGLVGNFGKKLAAAFPAQPWHIMLHELWLGGSRRETLKRRFWGALQKRGILTLIRQLHPLVLHTHATPYRQMLEKQGLPIQPLPLFANIEIAPPAPVGAAAALQIPLENRADYRVVVLFGSIHPEWEPALLLEKIAHPRLILAAMGRIGDSGLQRWQEFTLRHATEARFVHLGELPPAQISALLQFADAGVAATPWGLLEKSGSVAAMLEHGLPVLVTRNDFQSANSTSAATIHPAWSARCYPIWESDFSWSKLSKQNPQPALPAIAAAFLRDLKLARR